MMHRAKLRRLLPASIIGALALAVTTVPAIAQTPKQLGGPTPDKAPIEYAVPSALAEKTLLLGVAQAGDRLVTVGHWGHILISEDGGATWRQAKSVPTRTTLTAVYFADAQNGWAVGHDAIVIHTADGGETWEMQYSDPPAETPLLTVWFENATHGIAAGAFSFMIETFDGGKTWEVRDLLEDPGEDFYQPHLNHIFWGPDRSNQVMIAAEAGYFFRSEDAGKTWAELQTPYDGSFWAGLTSSSGRVFALGMRGNMFRSDDLGDTWTAVETGTDQSLSSGLQLEDGTIIAVGLGGAVLYSSDGGDNFTATIRPSRTGLSAVAKSTEGDVLIFGEQGIVRQPAKPPAG